jgi:predicted N-acetyltransferase YhbS
MAIVYSQDRPGVDEVIRLFSASGLNAPIEDAARMERMLASSQMIIVARASGGLVGLIRVLTDFSFNAFVADLAVLPQWQRKGVGSELMRQATSSYPTVKFVVHPGGDSREFYLKLGFIPAEICVVLPRTR